MTTVDVPTLRLVPAPNCEPPYDDEAAAASGSVEGSLALAFPPTAVSVPLSLVPPADPWASRPALVAAAPEPRGWSVRLVQALVEILAGARPAAQLARWTTLDVLEDLERWTGRLAHGPGVTRRAQVRSVHVSEPVAGVAEACAVVDTGARQRAVALRLESMEGRWRCTDVQLG
jgi:hypothetical protein